MDQIKGAKKVSLFSTEAKSLLSSISTLNISHFLDGERQHKEENEIKTEEHVPIDSTAHCNSCHVTFIDREDQVEHYQLDWHRFNLKRKLKGLCSQSQDEFERQSDDLSSISGSNSESENEVEREEDGVISYGGSPLISFTVDGALCAIYKALVTKNKNINDCDVMESLTKLTKPQLWIILMKSGGHFAGAVFRDLKVLDHKTFHRYTVRAKRGTVQSSRDSHQGAHKPRSAGASLRRYNEAALEQEIDDLILSWKDYIKEADAIFVRAPKYYKHPFTTGRHSPLTSGDPRIRQIPFITRRPTFHQVKSVQLSLATVYCGIKPSIRIKSAETHSHTATVNETHSHTATVDETHSHTAIVDVIEDVIQKEEEEEEKEVVPKNKKKRRKPKEKKVEIVDPQLERLHHYCMNNDVEQLMKLLNEMDLQPLTSFPSSVPSNDDAQVTSVPSILTSVQSSNNVPSDNVPLINVPSSDDVPVTNVSSDNVPVTNVSSDDVPVTNVPSNDVPVTNVPFDDVLVTNISPSNNEQLTSVPFSDDISATNLLSSNDVPATNVPSSDDIPPTSLPSSDNVPVTSVSFKDVSNVQDLLNSTMFQSTLLHIASSCGHVDIIRILLLHGANPVIKDGNGKVPYSVAKDRATRDCFRRFMSHYPLAYDYVTAQIPSPLSQELETLRKEKKAEKKRQLRKAQQEKKKESKTVAEMKKTETKQQQVMSELSDREKRALAAEKRLATNSSSSTGAIDITKYGICSWCQSSLCGIIPFERLQYKYCRIECVREHRQFLSKN